MNDGVQRPRDPEQQDPERKWRARLDRPGGGAEIPARKDADRADDQGRCCEHDGRQPVRAQSHPQGRRPGAEQIDERGTRGRQHGDERSRSQSQGPAAGSRARSVRGCARRPRRQGAHPPPGRRSTAPAGMDRQSLTPLRPGVVESITAPPGSVTCRSHPGAAWPIRLPGTVEATAQEPRRWQQTPRPYR